MGEIQQEICNCLHMENANDRWRFSNRLITIYLTMP